VRRTAPLFAVALAACEPGQGADGHSFEVRETDHPFVTVTRIEHGSLADLRRAAAEAGARVESGREVFAFALVDRSQGTCAIHFVKPEHDWRPEWIGHELAHCFYGRWHD